MSTTETILLGHGLLGGNVPWPPSSVHVPGAPAQPPGTVAWATGEALLDYKGCLGTLMDSQNRVVWTPALPGAPADVVDEWLTLLRQAGATHVPIGPFKAGPVYPGIVAWDNPDWLNDPAAIRSLVLKLLNTPSADGLGFRPTIFSDAGDPENPIPRLTAFYPVLSQALDGLDDYVIVLPCGWEPVVGAYRSGEVSWGFETWHNMRPKSVIGYHGSPKRLVGSSNPVQSDDPWKGAESEFYLTHGGQHVKIAFYQTPHGRELYRPCQCPNRDQPFGHIGDKEAEKLGNPELECWANRWEDYVARIGTGYHGWRVLKLVLYEVGTYETTHGDKTAADTVPVVRLGKSVADKWKVAIGYGDGLPN